MKFSLFAHMERIDQDQSHAQLYEEFIRLKVYEKLGYDEYAYWIDCGMPFIDKKASARCAWVPAPSWHRSGTRSSWPAKRP